MKIEVWFKLARVFRRCAFTQSTMKTSRPRQNQVSSKLPLLYGSSPHAHNPASEPSRNFTKRGRWDPLFQLCSPLPLIYPESHSSVVSSSGEFLCVCCLISPTILKTHLRTQLTCSPVCVPPLQQVTTSARVSVALPACVQREERGVL